MSHVSLQPNATTCVSLGSCHMDSISKASAGATEPPGKTGPPTSLIPALSTPGPGGQQPRKAQLHRQVQSWPHGEQTRSADCNCTVILVFYLITTTRVKSLINTLNLSKSELRLIYITTSKHTEKGCHLRDLMFPGSNKLAFIGPLCIFTRKKSWHRDIKQFKAALATVDACLQLLKNMTSAMIEQLSIWVTSSTVSECPMGSTPKKMTFLLINISVYSNQGRAVNWSQDAK